MPRVAEKVLPIEASGVSHGLRPFLSAAELKSHYGVFGHFYSVELASGEIVECRSVLEIAATSCMPHDYSQLSLRSPDAVFIMMNPGSSKPLVEVHNRIHARKIHQLAISLVPTKPDITQYQVMRLMLDRHWRHVRVLNLSDLRSAKSPEFIKLFQRLERDVEYESHSIFSDHRVDELIVKLPKKRTTPLVLAWGMSDKLDPLIERCLSKLPQRSKINGLLEPGTTNKYRHPLPTLQRDQRIWLEKMIQHFQGGVM